MNQLLIDVSNKNAIIMNKENDENKEIQLSLTTKELIDPQNIDTFARQWVH